MPDQPALIPPHEPTITANPGRQGGPDYAYRGATISSNAPGTLFHVVMPDAPFDG